MSLSLMTSKDEVLEWREKHPGPRVTVTLLLEEWQDAGSFDPALCLRCGHWQPAHYDHGSCGVSGCRCRDFVASGADVEPVSSASNG